MVLYLTPSRRATAIASETRRAPIPPEMPRLPTRASSPSTFMAITEVSRETRSIEGHCDVARVAFAATSRTRRRRVFQKGNALGAARDALAAEKAVVGSIRPRRVRFFSDASVRAFRTRSSSLGAIGRVSSARGASRARDRRPRRGRSFFFFRNVDFFHVVFFFAARQHPVPAKPGSRSGRAVARSPPRANRPPTRERRDGTLVIPMFPPRSRARRGRGGRGATRPARDASANSANVSFSRSASGFFFATRFCFLHSQKTSSPLRALQTRESPRRRRSGRCGRMSSSSKR